MRAPSTGAYAHSQPPKTENLNVRFWLFSREAVIAYSAPQRPGSRRLKAANQSALRIEELRQVRWREQQHAGALGLVAQWSGLIQDVTTVGPPSA